MSGLEASAVAISAFALLVALVLAGLWRRARRELRELRSTVEELARRPAGDQAAPSVSPAAPHPGRPAEVERADQAAAAGEPTADPAVTLPAPASRRADAIVTAEGRTIVIPTTAQVVDATMGRPLVRVSALAYGLRRALRPEQRDRIRSLMRREYQRRRKMRRRAARRAARMAPVHRAEEEIQR